MTGKEISEKFKADFEGHLHHWAESVQWAIEDAIIEEREACAKVALSHPNNDCSQNYGGHHSERCDCGPVSIAKAIRRRNASGAGGAE